MTKRELLILQLLLYMAKNGELQQATARPILEGLLQKLSEQREKHPATPGFAGISHPADALTEQAMWQALEKASTTTDEDLDLLASPADLPSRFTQFADAETPAGSQLASSEELPYIAPAATTFPMEQANESLAPLPHIPTDSPKVSPEVSAEVSPEISVAISPEPAPQAEEVHPAEEVLIQKLHETEEKNHALEIQYQRIAEQVDAQMDMLQMTVSYLNQAVEKLKVDYQNLDAENEELKRHILRMKEQRILAAEQKQAAAQLAENQAAAPSASLQETSIIQEEPVQAEPIQAEPIQAEPVQAEPIQVESVQAEPVQVAAAQVAEPVMETPIEQAAPAFAEEVAPNPVEEALVAPVAAAAATEQQAAEATQPQMEADWSIAVPANPEKVSSQLGYGIAVAEKVETGQSIRQTNHSLKRSLHFTNSITTSFFDTRKKLSELFADSLYFSFPDENYNGNFLFLVEKFGMVYMVMVRATFESIEGQAFAMASNFTLNNIIRVKKFINPSKLIEEYFASMESALPTLDDQQKHQIDVGICLIDTLSYEVEFASTGFPLYTLYGTTLETITGGESDQNSIGLRRFGTANKYHIRKLNLMKGAQMYFSSVDFDQVQVQMGGKLSSLNDKVVELCKLPGEQRMEPLRQFFSQHALQHPGHQDILLVGLTF